MRLKQIITISLITSTFLIGATIADNNNEAIKLLKSQQPQKAFELLEKEYKSNNFDNQTLFLLGTSAKQSGNYKSAIKYFEELLKRDNGAMRVRLDLATVYYKTGELKKAKELLLIVKASNPPKKVGDNIDNFLATIAKGVPRSYSLYASIGYQYDSNVNAGPNTDTVLIYDLPFTLSDDAKETSDRALKYSFGFNHLKQFSKVALQSSINVNITDYRTVHTLDTKSLSISSGPTWKQNLQTTFSVPVIFNVSKIGHIDRYYSFSLGVSPQVNYRYRPNISFTTSLSLTQKKYYNNPDKQAHSWMLSPSMRYFIDQSSVIDFGGYAGHESSKTDTSSTTSRGLNLAYNKSFSKKLNLNLSTSYSSTKYGGEEVAYSATRDDKTSSFNTGISYFVEQYKFNVSLNATYTKNNSNIEMYDYKRRQIGVNLSKSF